MSLVGREGFEGIAGVGAPQHGLAAVLFDISTRTWASLLLTWDHTGDGWEGL